MCKLTDEEMMVVYEALKASVELDDYEGAVAVLDLQDQAFEILHKAVNQ
jgi:hypothetical protein